MLPFSKITEMYSNESKFKMQQDISHLHIPKEDIFFAWLEKIDLKNDSINNIRVVTMSFPDYKKMTENYGIIKNAKDEMAEKIKDQLENIKSNNLEQVRQDIFYDILFNLQGVLS